MQKRVLKKPRWFTKLCFATPPTQFKANKELIGKNCLYTIQIFYGSRSLHFRSAYLVTVCSFDAFLRSYIVGLACLLLFLYPVIQILRLAKLCFAYIDSVFLLFVVLANTFLKSLYLLNTFTYLKHHLFFYVEQSSTVHSY